MLSLDISFRPNSTNQKEARTAAQSVVDALPDPLVLLDADLNVLAANRAFLDRFHLDISEIRGLPFFKLSGGFWNNTRLGQRVSKLVVKGEAFRRFKLEGNIPECGPKTLFYHRETGGAGRRRGADPGGADHGRRRRGFLTSRPVAFMSYAKGYLL